MTPSVLQSVDAVAACAKLRAALADRGVLPGLAKPLAKCVVAQESWLARWHMLWSGSGLGPHQALVLLRECGLIGEARHGR